MPEPFDNSSDIQLINRFDNVFFQTRKIVREREKAQSSLEMLKEDNGILQKKNRQLEEKNKILEKKYSEEVNYSAKLIKIVGNKLKQTDQSESAKDFIEELIIEIDSLIAQLRE